MRIGFHVPTAGGWVKTLRRARERRCETIQVFVGAPVQWHVGEPAEADVAAWREGILAQDIRPVSVHACYLVNLASPHRALWRKSARRLATDLGHAALLGGTGVVVHLGSPGKEAGGDRSRVVARVAAGIDAAIEEGGSEARVLLENSAGMGHGVGSSYGEIGEVIGASRYPERLAVCLDSAHSFAAGYAWHEPQGLDLALAEADRSFGLERLALVHANDSRAAFGSRVDRHWHIGQGRIGANGFRVILNHPLLRDLPIIMETPEASLEADLRNLWALRRCIRVEYRPPVRRG